MDDLIIGQLVFVRCAMEEPEAQPKEGLEASERPYEYTLPLSLGKATAIRPDGDGGGTVTVAWQRLIVSGEEQQYEGQWTSWNTATSGRTSSKSAVYKSDMSFEDIRPFRVGQQSDAVMKGEGGKKKKRKLALPKGAFLLDASTLAQLCEDQYGEYNK